MEIEWKAISIALYFSLKFNKLVYSYGTDTALYMNVL